MINNISEIDNLHSFFDGLLYYQLFIWYQKRSLENSFFDAQKRWMIYCIYWKAFHALCQFHLLVISGKTLIDTTKITWCFQSNAFLWNKIGIIPENFKLIPDVWRYIIFIVFNSMSRNSRTISNILDFCVNTQNYVMRIVWY